MVRLLILSAFLSPLIAATEMELVVMSQEPGLQEVITKSFAAHDAAVVEDVRKQDGFVVRWASPIEDGKIYDLVEIYDYRKDPLNKDGGGYYHKQVPLRALYRLNWTKNKQLAREKECLAIAHATVALMRGTFAPEVKATAATLTHDPDLDKALVQGLGIIALKPDTPSCSVSVQGSDVKDGHIIRAYHIILQTADPAVAWAGSPGHWQLGRLEVMRYKNGAAITPQQIATMVDILGGMRPGAAASP